MVGRLLRDAARSGSTDMAIEADLGMKTDQLSEEWHAALRRLAEQLPKNSFPAGEVAELLTKPRGLGGELDVSPSLSPDGTKVAFLSERSLFSIDLYIANAETGEILHPREPDRRRSPFQQPAVHSVRRWMERRGRSIRVCRDLVGPRSAGDLRRRATPYRAGAAIARGRRSLQSDLVA